MSVPFIIWTLRRTGGTTLSNLLMDLSDRPRLIGEPFNWDRELGWISREFEDTRNEALLRERLREVLAPGPSIKHAYDVGSDRLTSVLMQAASDAGYRHIMLTRAGEVGRLLSLEVAEMTGHWGLAETQAAYDEVRAGTRRLPPIDIPGLIGRLHISRAMTAMVEAEFTRLGVDPIRVDFSSLYADAEAGRAVVLELCQTLDLNVNDVDTFNEKLSIALTTKGQKSAEVYDAVPNIADARQALLTETARLPTHTSRFVMQQCRLPAAEQLVLRIDAPLLPDREIYFDDEAGRPILAVMCRTERRLGGEVARVVVSRHEADGSWGPAVVADLPGGELAAPLSLGFGWGQVQLQAAGRTVLGFDPIRSFGPETVPQGAAYLRTNFDLRRISLRTGDEMARQLGYAARRPARPGEAEALAPGVTLILMTRAPDRPTRDAQAQRLAGSFAAVTVLDAFSDGPEATDALIEAALAAVGTRQVLVASGGWTDDVLAATAAMAAGQDNLFVPLGQDAVWRAGLRWGLLAPTRAAGRPVLGVMAGLVTVEPAFLALADWRKPQGGAAAFDLDALRSAAARLPFALRRDGTTMQQLPQPTLHPLVVGAAPDAGPLLSAAGARVLSPDAGLPGSLGALIDRLGAEARDIDAAEVVLMPGGGVAQAAALCRQPLSEVVAAPAGLRLSGPVLALIAARIADTADLADTLSAPQTDMAGLICALSDLIRRLGIEVQDLPDADAPARPDGAGTEPVWMPPDAMLAVAMQRAASPGADAAIAALRQVFASPAAFGRLVVQCVAAQVMQVVDVVSNLDLDAQGGHRIARMLDVLRPTGLLADPELLMGITGRLAARHYFDEVRALVAKPMRKVSPQTRLALTAADIAASVFDPADRRFTGDDPARLLPADLPPGSHLATFGEQLTHYLSARRDWRGLLAAVDLIGPDNLSNYSYEHWMMARIGLGMIEGTDALIAAGHEAWRLHDWSTRRLALHLAHRSGDPRRIDTAIAEMLKNDPEMAPLTAQPTPFKLVAGTPGIAADQTACVIVVRNEFTRLKWLVDYYRTLGVAQIVLIDNMSTDETVAHFAGQPDICILQTTEAYRDARFGVKWHNEVCARYFEDRWVLTVDADEVLVFDGSDQPGALTTLTQRLDAAGDQAFATAMIDMYSEVPLDQLHYHPGDSLIEAFPLFDGSGYWFDRTASFPDTTVSGGVRIRRFWNARHDPRLPYISMQKAPLVRWQPGFRYLSSTHEMTPCRVAVETGALLHFKFLPDFHQRAMEEVARAQHYDGAREYRIYAEILKDPANRSFRYAGSVRYDGPQTLIRAGLMVPQGAVPALEARRA